MNRIKEIRLQKELMQKDVARRACISSPYLHDIANGNRKAGPDVLRRIAKAMECTVEELKGDSTDGKIA
jgi:transcriptional regulator with XRE-family HTH domain